MSTSIKSLHYPNPILSFCSPIGCYMIFTFINRKTPYERKWYLITDEIANVYKSMKGIIIL